MSSIDIYQILEDQRQNWSHDARSKLAIESCINRLREAESQGYFGKLYRTDFVVEGRDSFPIDMLRYTSAAPKSEADARAIEDSYQNDKWRQVTLTMTHRDPTPQLAEKRWESKFDWRVVTVVETVGI